MNAAEQLSIAISRELPDAVVSIDAPAHETGHWWIDVTYQRRNATIEWRPKQGFGVGLGPGGYGEGPDLVVPTVDAAASHVTAYLSPSVMPAEGEATVLIASGDQTWRSAVEERLRSHRIYTDVAGTIKEAYDRSLNQAYSVLLIDVSAEPPTAYGELRDLAARKVCFVVTVATSDRISTLDDSFEMVMNKRMGTEYVASVVEGLVSASVEQNPV